jgi:ABC-type microcin C transport system permease subunit YejB
LAGEWEAMGNAFSHLVLPASLLGYFSLAYISRMTRSFMLNELSQEYVITARAKGISERRIIWNHALRNAMVPLLTVVALSYAHLLEGSVLKISRDYTARHTKSVCNSQDDVHWSAMREVLQRDLRGQVFFK